MKSLLKLILAGLAASVFATPSFADDTATTYLATKNAIKPNIKSLEFVSSDKIVTDDNRFDWSKMHTAVATVEFENACVAGKMDVVAIDFSTGPEKPVQQYLLMLVDKDPMKICGHLPPWEDASKFIVVNKYQIANLPNDITNVTVNGIEVPNP